ncbi:MAG: MFS transporter [Candidatus Accumulibacter delftensis]|jgi:DHA1 family bicyclomycin/chloramphenicol resistance-like MFS transporter
MTLWHGADLGCARPSPGDPDGVALFALASAGCMFATQHRTAVAAARLAGDDRGAGMVVCRAIVRDLYDGALAQRLMSQIMMMFAIAPAVAPIIGGWLQLWFGWRAVFAFLVLLSIALWLACWYLLPETLPVFAASRSMHATSAKRSYWKVLTAPAFLLTCGALALNFAAFFLYVVSAPVFLMDHLGVSPTGFLWLFGPAMSGLMLGACLSSRLAGKWSARPHDRRRLPGDELRGPINIGFSLALPPARCPGVCCPCSASPSACRLPCRA